MSHVALILPILLALALAPAPEAPAPAPPSADTLRVYEEVKAEAGNDPKKLVQLALWCEEHGMGAEKTMHLEAAARLDPKAPAAHGLLGLVDDQGRWATPEATAERVKADAALSAKLAEYDARRDKIEHDTEIERRMIADLESHGKHLDAQRVKLKLDHLLAPEHVRIGLWCEQNGLKAEATAHFTTALHLDPHNEATWRHLGYIKHDGRWMSHEQIAAADREAQEQTHADRHWEPLIRKWVSELSDRHHRAEAEASLAKVDDPRAVPSIVHVLRGASHNGLLLAVRLLGQINAPASSRQLAALAVYNDDPDVRQAAALALRGREPRDFADRIVNLIHAPMTYQVQPVGGPGSKGALVVDSPRFRITRTYTAPPAFRLSSTFHGYVGYDGNGLPVVMSGFDRDDYLDDIGHLAKKHDYAAMERVMRGPEIRTANLLAAANLKAALARERMVADIRDVEMSNARAETINQRAEAALRTALDAPADLREDDEDGWHSWYYDRIGYRYTPPPKVYAAINALPQSSGPTIVSCFAAGTPVRTLQGPRPIETLRTGDQVLSQDVSTGGLSFRPILAVHHNPPDATLRIATDNGDAVVASRFHRFWRVGRGWAMARDLKPGDVLRTIDGPTRIVSVEAAPVQPVFNLDIDESRTYFVGGSAMLVHDNTLPPTQPSTNPFDLASTSAPLRP